MEFKYCNNTYRKMKDGSFRAIVHGNSTTVYYVTDPDTIEMLNNHLKEK